MDPCLLPLLLRAWGDFSQLLTIHLHTHFQFMALLYDDDDDHVVQILLSWGKCVHALEKMMKFEIP